MALTVYSKGSIFLYSRYCMSSLLSGLHCYIVLALLIEFILYISLQYVLYDICIYHIVYIHKSIAYMPSLSSWVTLVLCILVVNAV